MIELKEWWIVFPLWFSLLALIYIEVLALKKFLKGRFFILLILVVSFGFFVRSSLLEVYRIPTSSMVPKIHVNDLLLVNLLSFGFRLPLNDNVMFSWGKIRRGDVVVFLDPREGSRRFIKRVIALPGDVIKLEGHDLYLNGAKLQRDGFEDFNYFNKGGLLFPAVKYRESISKDFSYEIVFDKNQTLRYIVKAFYCNQELQVPEGHFFAIGDNRDGSTDSRHFGFVPIKNLLGRPLAILFSHEDGQFHMDRSGFIGDR